MMELLGYIGMVAFLTIEGWMLTRLLVRTYGATLPVALALPLGALINTLAYAVLSLIGISLHLVAILTSNIGVFLIVLILIQPFIKTKNTTIKNYSPVSVPIILTILSCVILAGSALYAVSHALLPTFHYDSLTNWNMRSKVSYYRAEMVFNDQGGLVAKPHYPFLFHALQITAMQLLPSWSDMAANSIHLLLMLSAFAALWLMLSQRGKGFATVVTAVVIGIPLMTLHAGQSYADITLISFAVLSLITFVQFREHDDRNMLLLSALFLGASTWTKEEGLFFCYLPWVVMMIVVLLRRPGSIASLRLPVSIGLLLSLTWPIFALLKGLSLTPHGSSDAQLQFSMDAGAAMIDALFVSGSFGIFWYACILLLLLLVFGLRTGRLEVDRHALITLLWGLLSMLGYMGVYLFTSNTEYLIIGQSFDRQMLLPAALMTISLAMIFTPRRVL